MPSEKCETNAVPDTACECACNSAPRQLTDKEMVKKLEKQLSNACERSKAISSQLYKVENKAQVLEEMLYDKTATLKQEFDLQRQISKNNERYRNSLWQIYDLLDRKERRTDLEKEMLDIVKGALEIRD